MHFLDIFSLLPLLQLLFYRSQLRVTSYLFPSAAVDHTRLSVNGIVNDDITLVLLLIALSYRPLSITFRFYLDIDSSVALTSSRQLFRSFFLILFSFFYLSHSMPLKHAGNFFPCSLWWATQAQHFPCLGHPSFVQGQSMELCGQGIE